MKRLLAVLLSLAMLLSLAACGGSAERDPNAGKYIGISAAVGGFAMPMSDVYPGETWIELKSGGKGSIMLDKRIPERKDLQLLFILIICLIT